MTHDDILAYIVTETLRSALRERPQDVPTEAARVLPGLRRALGGERHYIPKQGATLGAEDQRRQAVVRDALTAMPTREIEQRHGVSRSTIYRLVKRSATGK